MSLNGEGVEPADKVRPRKSARTLEELIKGLCSEGADLDKNTLGVAKKDVGQRHSLGVARKGYSAVDSRYSLIAEGVDLLAEKMLEPEKAGSHKL